MTNSLDTSEAEAQPWVKPAQSAPGEEGAPALTKEDMALGAFLAAMHDTNLDGGKMREAMLNVLGLTATQQPAFEYMHPIAILTKEVKPAHWEPQQAAPSQVAGEMPDTDGSFPEWKVGSFAFKQWCHQYFGPDADDGYLAEAVLQLPRKQVLPMKAADEFELHRLLAEERYTVRQLTRALRDAVEPPTFMGEPVGKAALLEASAQREQPAAMPPLKKDDIEFVLKNFSKRISDLQQEVESGCIGLKIGIEKLHDRLLPNAPSLNESEAFEQSKVTDRIIEQPAASKPEPQAQAGEPDYRRVTSVNQPGEPS